MDVRVRLSAHALERCIERNIDPQMVKERIRACPELDHCVVNWLADKRYRFTVKIGKQSAVVITVVDIKPGGKKTPG